MFSLITGLFSLFCVALIGWTITTYFVKEDSQKKINEELKNLFNISKMFYVSLKGLIGVLARTSFSSDSSEKKPINSDELNEPSISLVQPEIEVESPSLGVSVEENDDTALSSFSPEVIEVIKEEEEKVA